MTGMDSDKTAARNARRVRAQASIGLGALTLVLWYLQMRGNAGGAGYSMGTGDGVALLIGFGLVALGAWLLDKNRRGV